MSADQLAATVVAGLISAGVRDVVAAPGSRNAPLLIALEQAERDGKLRLHVRIDERTASYTALGLAKSSGLPAAVVTTSGTAVGTLLPATMEAHHSQVPLLLLTADRPAAMRDTGANQTTMQPGMFTNFVRSEIGLSSREPGRWAFSIARALASALGRETRDPGPVHVNLEFSEPLLGNAKLFRDAETTLVPRAAVGEPPVDLDDRPGTIMLVGDASPELGRRAALTGFNAGIPVLAEPSSNARIPGAIQCYDLLLSTVLRDAITRVVVVGRPTLSRAQRNLLCDRNLDVVQVSPTATNNRYPATTQIVPGVRMEPTDDHEWLTRWQEADERVARQVEKLADLEPLNGWGVAASVVSALGENDNLVWGSSRLARDADLAPVEEEPPAVYANRGLAGIDGLIATASGIALGSERPTTLVLGDLSAIHDVSSLVLPSAETRPNLRIVVGNDDGGSIFATLEQGSLPQRVFERVFAVPHGRTLNSVAAALGVSSMSARGRGELDEILAQPPQGVELVECPLVRHDRRERVAQLRSWTEGLLGARA